jgi:hypothetical protein
MKIKRPYPDAPQRFVSMVKGDYLSIFTRLGKFDNGPPAPGQSPPFGWILGSLPQRVHLPSLSLKLSRTMLTFNHDLLFTYQLSNKKKKIIT